MKRQQSMRLTHVPLLVSHLKSKSKAKGNRKPQSSSPPSPPPTSSSTSSSSNYKYYNLYDASTSQLRSQLLPATPTEISLAIHNGKVAQHTWYNNYTPSQRSDVLLQTSIALSDPQTMEELIYLEVCDTSRTKKEISSYDVPTAIETLRYYSSEYYSSKDYSNSCMNGDGNTVPYYTQREPLGLTLGIGAWNYPLMNVISKSAPALLFGNSMVYKPSEYTPSSALFIAKLYEECGLPSGVFQVLLGGGSGVGKELVRQYCNSGLSANGNKIDMDANSNTDTEIDMDYEYQYQYQYQNNEGKISFTGSLETGRQIAAQSTALGTDTGTDTDTRTTRNFHRLNLELGGKSPLIIMPDCNNDNDNIDTNANTSTNTNTGTSTSTSTINIHQAVKIAMQANWYSNGQVCSNGTRVYVHKSIHDEFVKVLVQETKKLRIGHPMDDGVDIGPMVSKEQFDRVRQYIDVGRFEDGATLCYGGERVRVQPVSTSSSSQVLSPASENYGSDGDDNNNNTTNTFENGYFLSPAIFTNCRDDMRIVQEEVFGMLMCILTFDNEEEVLRRANATNFGLAAGIITNDMKTAHRMASKLRAGTVWVNKTYNTTYPAVPWGGVKQSGIGRENGSAALEAWTTEKAIYVDMNHQE